MSRMDPKGGRADWYYERFRYGRIKSKRDLASAVVDGKLDRLNLDSDKKLLERAKAASTLG